MAKTRTTPGRRQTALVAPFVLMTATADEAAAMIDSGDFDWPDVDFVFAIPSVFAFRDLDGMRDHPPA
jgi:hypothetical protein